jgi:4-hydroxy-tetrahydrodipicolinate synthase
MDTVPKFIQLIKQVQEEVGVGNARVRPPRLEVTGTELQETRAAVQHALLHQPSVKSTAFPK